MFILIIIFCLILRLTVFTGQRKYLTLADGLHDRTQEIKMVLNLFSLRNLHTFLLSFALLVFV